MKLVVGLGNPGEQYRLTLHNVGFRVVDLLASKKNLGRPANKSAAEFWKGDFPEGSALLLKPMTYMNLSGQAVGEFMRYYKIPPESLLVVSDDIELPPGALRYREKGGHGGHNGLRNIIQHIGESFKRLKIGVGRPNQSAGVSNHVLSGAGMNSGVIEQAVSEASDYALDFIRDGNIMIRPAVKT